MAINFGSVTRPGPADAVLATGLAVLAVVEAVTLPGGATPTMALGAIGAALALAWRRILPLATCVAVIAMMVGAAIVGTPIDALNVVVPVLAISIYSVARHASHSRAILGLVVSVVGAGIATFVQGGPGAQNLLFGLLVAGGPWGAGWLVRRQTEQAVSAALVASELERTQHDRQHQAVVEERARIARELHDIISHSVSVMTIQASAIEEVVAADPDSARLAAATIRRTGRDALDDLRGLLGLLNPSDKDDDRPLNTPHGLADLDELIDRFRQSGIAVTSSITGTPRDLPSAIDHCAYRVIQEALTNTLKHGQATAAYVIVQYAPGTIDINIADDGTRPPRSGAQPDTQGHGLVSMRQRVELLGGELDIDPTPNGFHVHTRLPTHPPSP